jgi:probable F420-dependent oxidoreductase
VDVGAITFVSDLGLAPGELAQAVESHGLSALFVTEHTHLPVEHGPTPWGSPPEPEYGRTLDPFVALGVAAERTNTIALGTAVCLVAQHDPIALAKAVATVDHISGGRLELGVGYGWCRPEIEDHGVAFNDRHRVVTEHVAAMRALWQPTPTQFAGSQIRFGASQAHPKPLGVGRPPVLLGASLSPTSLDHLVGWADGWIPSDRPSLIDDLHVIRSRLLEADRDPLSFAVTVVGPLELPHRIEQLAEAGVGRVLRWLPAGPPNAVLDALDELVT